MSKAIGIGAHGDVADFILVSRKADPIVGALTENDEITIGTHFRDCCILGDFARPGHHRPGDLRGEDLLLF